MCVWQVECISTLPVVPMRTPDHLRAGKTYGKPIFGVGFDLIKNLRENLFKTYLKPI